MSSYILLERIKVENANCIAGLTYGFPAVTAFLGFEHFLSRQFKAQFGIGFNGCAIFCHDYKVNSYEQYYTRFIQSRNPPSTLKGKGGDAKKPAPIIEESKMDMVVSLLLRCDNNLATNSEDINAYINALKSYIYSARLAGGSIYHIRSIRMLGNDMTALKRAILPSFVLLDATHLLEAHFNECQQEQPNKLLLDIWTDFFAYKEQAVQDDVVQDGATLNKKTPNKTAKEVTWARYIPPNKKGWIVPLMKGFKGISPLYDPSEVDNLRDTRYPFRFVEAVHGLGEWRSVHRLEDLDSIFWRYQVSDEWYLCEQTSHIKESKQSLIDDYFDDVFND